MEPKTLKDDDGEVVMSGIHTYGEVVHLFIEREDYSGVFHAGFSEMGVELTIRPRPDCNMSIIASATSVGTR